MKFQILLLALLSILISCTDDGIDAELHYDGENVNAPFLPAGTFESAARFTSDITSEYNGRFLEEVEFYLLQTPSTCEIRIYEEGNESTPGALLFSADVSGQVFGNSFNRYVIENPIEITGQDLWIAVRMDISQDLRLIGCDAGPAATNGDLLLDVNSGSWTTLRDFTNNEVDINWNIRGYLSE